VKLSEREGERWGREVGRKYVWITWDGMYGCVEMGL
jgi:hypothetical protein